MALDVVFLVDGSQRSVTNFNKQKDRIPHAKKFVTTLTGIAAYKAASKLSNTSNFYLVDHNFVLDDAFVFTAPHEYEKEYVHAWRYEDLETNPQVGFAPGFAGVYMFHKASLRTDADVLDKIGKGIKYVEQVASKICTLDVIIVAVNGATPTRNKATLDSIVTSSKLVEAATYQEAYEKANAIADTENYYVVDASFVPCDFKFEYRPHDYDAGYVHVWNCIDSNGTIRPGGIQLMNQSTFTTTNADFEYSFGDNIKIMEPIASKFDPEMDSIVFLSYDEPNAEVNWVALKNRFPQAVRVHGVEGILNAHKKAAEVSSSANFFVVDGDSEILDTFNFDLAFSEYDKLHYVHIWKCLNPVNGLEYGYGGVKLFHKKMFENFDEAIVDMSTLLGDGVKLMDEVATVTHFNSDEFHAFRGAYREATKLSSGIIKNQDDDESAQRLDVWCTKAEGDFSDYVLYGANLGREHGIANASDINKLQVVNKFSELYQLYRKFKMNKHEQELLYTKYNKIDTKLITNLTGLMYDENTGVRMDQFRDWLSRSELLSKFWLIDRLIKLELDEPLSALIVDGDNGILANFIFQFYGDVAKILSVESNARMEKVADTLNMDNVIDNWRFKAVTSTPYGLDYEDTKGIVRENGVSTVLGIEWNALIAPHCEKMYDIKEWTAKIPEGKLVIAQMNSYGMSGDANDLFDQFKAQLDLTFIKFCDIMPCEVYDRFMVIGFK